MPTTRTTLRKSLNISIPPSQEVWTPPSSYRPKILSACAQLLPARLGEFFGVTSRTVDNWIATIPEFKDEVQRARSLADAQVAESLYQRAVGYSHMVQRVVGRPGEEQVVEYRKSYPPETEACKHWLRNRRPQNWGGRVRPARQVAAEAKAFRVPKAANSNEAPPASIVEANDGVRSRQPGHKSAVQAERHVVPEPAGEQRLGRD